MSDFKTMATTVGSLLKEKGQTVAAAESSAGGIISAALLSVPGASAYFKGGGVVYTSAAKQILMAVSDAAMAEKRALPKHMPCIWRVRRGNVWEPIGALAKRVRLAQQETDMATRRGIHVWVWLAPMLNGP